MRSTNNPMTARNIRILVTGILVVILAGPVRADPQEQPNQRVEAVRALSTDPVFGPFFEEIELANPALQAARAAWQSQLNRVSPAGALPDPKLSVGLYLQEVETRVGPQQARLGITQGLPWKGKLGLKSDIVAAGAEALFYRYEDLKLQLFTDFKKQVFELAYLDRAIGVTVRHVDLLREWEALMEARYTTASAGLSDWIRIQLEIDRLDDRLATLRAARDPIVAELNRILNRPVHRVFAIPEGMQLLLPEKLPLSDDELQAAIEARNPELKALNSRVEEKNTAIRLSRKNFYPDFSVGVDFIQTGGASVSGVDGSGKDPVVLKFGMTIPLNRKKYRLLETAASEAAVSATRAKVDRLNQLRSRLSLLRFRYEDAVRKFRLYRDKLVPDTRDSLEVTVRGYEAGGDGFLDIIDTERTLLALELGLERAAVDGLKSLADIERITGIPLTSGQHTIPTAGLADTTEEN